MPSRCRPMTMKSQSNIISLDAMRQLWRHRPAIGWCRAARVSTGGNLAYFAVARVIAVERDPGNVALSYARLAEFLPFDVPVPWAINGR